MKIMSLNINRFRDKNKESINNKNITEIENYIDDFLQSNKDNLVILHEVPYCNNKIVCAEYTMFKNKLMNKYIVKIPDKIKKPIFISMIIQNKNSNWEKSEEKVWEHFCAYTNRIITRKYKSIYVIGMHMPDTQRKIRKYDSYESVKIWDDLITYFDYWKNQNIIILGDMNVFVQGTIQKTKYYELLSKGAIDAWIEKGNSNNMATYYTEKNIGSRIDYALMSASAYKMMKSINIDDNLRKKEITDHSAIIVEI